MSSFYNVGKAKFWVVWLAKVKTGDTTLSNIFKKLSNYPMNTKVNEFDTLCNFAYEPYGLKKQAPFKAWQTDHLISKPNVNIQMIVPSPSGILQHIKRACIQAGSFWKINEIESNIPDPIEWCWKPLPDGSFVPHYQDDAVTNTIKPIIASWPYSKGKCSNWSCKK